MSKVRRMLVALVAASLMVGLAAPVAGAQKKSPSNKQLDAKLNSTRKSLGKTNRSLKSTRTSLAATQGQVTDAVRDIGALTQRVAGTEGGLKGLLEAAPTLVKNLTDLGTAVRDTIGPGLTALQAALRNDVAPALTALQTGLQTLGGSVQTLGGSVQTIGTNLGTLSTTVGAIGSAVNNPTTGLAALNQRAAANEAEEDAKEYGVARVFRQAAGAGPLTALGTVWTPDIPDDGSNAAVANGAVVTPCAGGDVISVRGAIRGSETDGQGGASGPAGQAGAGLIIQAADGTLVGGGQTAANPDFGGVQVVTIPTSSDQESSNDPDADTGVEVVSVTLPDGLPAGQCVIEGTAQFFDFNDAVGGTD